MITQIIDKLTTVNTKLQEVKMQLQNKGIIENSVSITELPEEIAKYEPPQTEGIEFTNLAYMFYEGHRFQDVEKILKNTRQITSMEYAFYNAKNVKTDFTTLEMDLNTSQCTSFAYSFYNCCKQLKFKYYLDTSNVTTFQNAFCQGYGGFNVDFPNMLDTSSVINMSGALRFVSYSVNSDKTIIPFTTMEKVTSASSLFYSEFKGQSQSRATIFNYDTPVLKDANSMFYNADKFEEIYINFSKVTSANSTFNNCTSLRKLNFINTTTINTNINLATTGLDRDGLMDMLETLPEITITRVLTIGSEKKALLSEDDIAEFMLKGYSLA